MTFKELKARGVIVRRTPWDEYRVNFKGGQEATAYYTTDIDDAKDTAVVLLEARHVV